MVFRGKDIPVILYAAREKLRNLPLSRRDPCCTYTRTRVEIFNRDEAKGDAMNRERKLIRKNGGDFPRDFPRYSRDGSVAAERSHFSLSLHHPISQIDIAASPSAFRI